MKKSTVVVVERELLTSQAFLALRRKLSPQIFLLFMSKRQMANRGKKGREAWICTNNGKITFTYKEAQERYGISKKQFVAALDELVERGFVDVEHQGGCYQKDQSKYALSDRWKLYATPLFKRASRPKKVDRRGYQKRRRAISTTPEIGTHTHARNWNTKQEFRRPECPELAH